MAGGLGTMARVGLVAMAVISACGLAAQAADVAREGEGARRASLDKMELQDAPKDLWSKLSNWTTAGSSSSALDAAAVDGKPVLIVTWASWSKMSTREGLPLAQKMADKFGAEGLIVLGVHGEQGWEGAVAAAADRNAKFLIAHDSKNEFRKALSIDNDPDYYVIDRAGHLRYADITTASVEAACAEVTKETKDQAKDVPTLLADRDRQARDAAGATAAITQIELDQLPLVPPGYRQPSEDAYKAVDWPVVVEAKRVAWGFRDYEGNEMYPTLGFAPEKVLKTGLESPQGRITLIYFWNPKSPTSFSVMDQMDLLQKQNLRDLTVCGAAVPITSIEDSQLEPEIAQNQLKANFESFVRTRNQRHTLALDPNSSAISSLGGGGSYGVRSLDIPNPGGMLISSDNNIRWVGSVTSSDFKAALAKMLKNDPGVKARAKADQAFIAEQRK